MATTLTKTRTNGGQSVVTYASIGANDAENGDAFESSDFAQGLVIQATGNFGGGADVALEGSNDGSNFYAITRDIGDGMGLSAVTLSAAGLVRVEGPFPLYLRAAVNDQGDANTDLEVIIVGTNRR